ncbi:MAG: hypothetical protein JNM84_28135 [Planctomycetes bacterium]|nr:hypothetical protein [Planctomycetota bacterium]
MTEYRALEDLLARTTQPGGPSILDLLKKLASVSWETAGVALAFAGAIEVVMGARAGQAPGFLGKASVFTLPIQAFLVGAAIGQANEDERKQRRELFDKMRSLLLIGATDDALRLHRQKHRRSRLLDASKPLGIALDAQGEERWKALWSKWKSKIDREFRGISADAQQPALYRLPGTTSLSRLANEATSGVLREANLLDEGALLEAYLTDRFLHMRHEFLTLLATLGA